MGTDSGFRTKRQAHDATDIVPLLANAVIYKCTTDVDAIDDGGARRDDVGAEVIVDVADDPDEELPADYSVHGLDDDCNEGDDWWDHDYEDGEADDDPVYHDDDAGEGSEDRAHPTS